MTEQTKEEIQKISTDIKDETANSSNRLLRNFKRIITGVVDKVIPPYEPDINFDNKQIPGEELLQKAKTRHYNEIQILIGILFIVFGFILGSGQSILYFLAILGIVLFFTAYEIEQIVITSHRLLVRRIGMIERILRIPSDEEHRLSYVVSFRVGRAPPNIILVIISLIGFFSVLSNVYSPLTGSIVIIVTTLIFLIGLRLNRRSLTLQMAGAHNIVLGIRKGVPEKIINSMMNVIYQ